LLVSGLQGDRQLVFMIYQAKLALPDGEHGLSSRSAALAGPSEVLRDLDSRFAGFAVAESRNAQVDGLPRSSPV